VVSISGAYSAPLKPKVEATSLEGIFPWYQGFQQGKTAFSSPQTPTVANFVPCSQSLRAEIPAHAAREKILGCRERESAFGVMAGIGLLRPMALEKAWPEPMGNLGSEPFAFLAFNINPDGEPAVVPEAPAKP
jgi:hypothetical protein